MSMQAVVPKVSKADYAYRSCLRAPQAKTLFQPQEKCMHKEECVIGQASLKYESGETKCTMKASYAPESTESNPVVQVTVEEGGKRETYQVSINEVNPRRATELEMFALLSYTDDKGISDKGTLGSYQKLQCYADNAALNGYWEGNVGEEDYLNKRQDWQSVVISMWEEYSEAGNYSQVMSCMSLNDTMEKFSIRFVDFDSIQFEDRSAETSLKYVGADAKETADAEETNGEEEDGFADYVQMIREYVDGLFQRIQDGETEPKFQLGGRAYTVKEWNKLLEGFDSAQEAIRKLVRRQIEEQIEQAEKSAAQSEEARLDMITADTLKVRFLRQELDDDGNRKEDLFLVAFDSKGIRCTKPGNDTYEWEIRFTDDKQYEKAKEFMTWADSHMDNFLFCAHENFWQDFLGGSLDVAAFQEFLTGTNNGIPNYGVMVGDSMYFERSNVQWAKYMNHPEAEMLTAQELTKQIAAQIEENQKNLTKLTNPYDEIYRKYHREYDGAAIFCEYPGGPLYTADEIGERISERVMLEREPKQNN